MADPGSAGGVTAEILTVGTELLTPGRVDTNSVYLIETLYSVGIPVVFRASVGDDHNRITEALRQALARADLVVTTGGLGPTGDDLTREALCEALHLALELDPAVLSAIEERFRRRNRDMPAVNRRQAMVPSGAEVLPNEAGTAPGLWVRAAGEKDVILLPGPPGELRNVFEKHVLPRLAARARGTVYRTKKMLVAGLAESAVEQRIGPIYARTTNPATTILASSGQVEIHLTARGRDGEEAERALESLAAPLRESLAEHLFSESGEPLEQVVGRLLAERGLRLAVAESCTGGLVAHRITEVAGSSAYFERGFVTYGLRSKVELLGVPESLLEAQGAVSDPVARAMARGARQLSETHLGLSVTGVAGPGGGAPDAPVGRVYVGLSDASGEIVERLDLPGNRSQVKWWASQAALNLLRLRLLGGR